MWAYCIGRSYVLPDRIPRSTSHNPQASARSCAVLSAPGPLKAMAHGEEDVAGAIARRAQLPRCFKDVHPKLTIQVSG